MGRCCRARRVAHVQPYPSDIQSAAEHVCPDSKYRRLNVHREKEYPTLYFASLRGLYSLASSSSGGGMSYARRQTYASEEFNVTLVDQDTNLDLIFAVLRCCFRFILALQRSVHAFVQPPMTVHRDPVEVQFLLDIVQSFDRSFEHRCVGDVE